MKKEKEEKKSIFFQLFIYNSHDINNELVFLCGNKVYPIEILLFISLAFLFAVEHASLYI